MESQQTDTGAAPRRTPVVQMPRKELANGSAANARPVPRRCYGQKARSVLLPVVLAALCAVAAYLVQVNPWREAQSQPGVVAVGLPELSSPPVSFAGHDGSDTVYQVTFDGNPTWILHSRKQGKDDTVGSNNVASFTMKRADDGGYVPVRVEVQDKLHDAGRGDEWSLRPSHFHDKWEWITDIDASKSRKGFIAFTVNQPLQVSVELGDFAVLFQDGWSWNRFNSLILAFNPPYDEMPVPFPKVTSGQGKNMKCESEDRDCVVASTNTPCDEPLEVAAGQDLYFPIQKKKHYIWEEGCGDKPKKIVLGEGARLFVDEDVIVYAFVVSPKTTSNAGVYGYGAFSNFFMNYEKKSRFMPGLVKLIGDHSVVWGPVLMDSTFRNIVVGTHAEVAWTKSFSFIFESDCVDPMGAGLRVHNNFFKTSDDCLKAFFPDAVFADNIVWHSIVGRVILLSWGNYGVGANMVDNQDIFYYNTSIIHDEQAYISRWDTKSKTDVAKVLAKHQVGSYLIGAFHSPANSLGRPDNPIVIENVFMEGDVAVAIQLSTGYCNMDNKAKFMRYSTRLGGCSGDIHIELKGLDMSRTMSHRSPNVITGCQDDENPDIINGQCLCREELNCPKGKQCKVDLKISGLVEHPRHFLKENLVVGKNVVIKGEDDELIFG